MFDAAVVGASLAGASCALRLASRGFSVALIEKSSFPRRRCCGDLLSVPGAHLLKMLGLSLDALPHLSLSGKVIVSGNNKRVSLENGTPWAFGVSRGALDQELRAIAEAHPFVTTFPERVNFVFQDGSGGTVVTSNRDIRAKYLVIATGLAPIPTVSEIVTYARRPQDRFGFTIPLRGRLLNDGDRQTVLIGSGYELSLTPVSDEELSVTALGSREAIRSLIRRGTAPLVSMVAEEGRFLGVESDDGLALGPAGHRVTRRVCGRIVLVGDAAESLDPLAGMGMTHALLSGSMTGETLADHLEHGTGLSVLESAIHERMNWIRRYSGLTRTVISTLGGRGLSLVVASGAMAMMQRRMVNALPQYSELGSGDIVVPTPMPQWRSG